MIKKLLTLTVIGGLLQVSAPTLKAQDNMTHRQIPHISAFPTGEKLPEQFAQFFIGQAYLAPLTQNKSLNVPVSNVTFEPGCRNNWHSHTGGQILIAVGGKGYYQARGEKARLLLPGDVVEIPADVEHWHGAAPDSWFSHLAIECNPQTNRNTWLDPVDDKQYGEATATGTNIGNNLSDKARKNLETLLPGFLPAIQSNNPELAEIWGNFAFDEIQNYGQLETKLRQMAVMVSCIATQSPTMYDHTLQGALATGLTPEEAQEMLYQAVPYVGMAKVLEFVALTDEILARQGCRLPLAARSTTTPATRFNQGLALQQSLFGERIAQMQASAPDSQKHIQRYLSANCFGDYQTRTGLDARTRELLTFSMLISLGGCESQVKGHIQGNLKAGNDKATLLATVTQLLPYIGYPRTLNALACINEVIPE